MASRLINWGDRRSIERDLLFSLTKMTRTFSERESSFDVDVRKQKATIEVEQEEWNRHEPGESDTIYYSLVLNWGDNTITLIDGNTYRPRGKVRFFFLADTNPAKLARVVDKLVQAKAPKPNFGYSSPSLDDTAPMEHFTERGARSVKQASTGYDLLFSILDQKTYFKLMDKLEKAGDEQSARLLQDVLSKLSNLLDIPSGAEQALARTRQMFNDGLRWDPALLRNNVFKAANSLGLKLPSHMFASGRSAGHYSPGFDAVKPPAGFKSVGENGWIRKMPDGQILTVDLYQYQPGKDHFKAYIRPRPGAGAGPIKIFDSAAKAFDHVLTEAKKK